MMKVMQGSGAKRIDCVTPDSNIFLIIVMMVWWYDGGDDDGDDDGDGDGDDKGDAAECGVGR